MRISSVFFSITFFFLLSSASIVLAYLWQTQYDKQKYTKELNLKYSFIANASLYHLDKNTSKEDFIKQIQAYSIDEILNENLKSDILKNAKVLQAQKNKTGESAILVYQKNHYLKIKHNENLLLLKDSGYQPYRYDVIKMIFALVFLVVLLAYIVTIRKLKPLRSLKRQIDKFAKGEFENISCKAKGDDEIAEVSKAFCHAVSQIQKLNSSRQLFLRNIMHELKTPITKGRITAEMMEKGKHQQRLIDAFNRLEKLINEFATIEQITSQIHLNIKTYRLVDLFDEAIDLVMANKENISFSMTENMSLSVDFKLFSVALKNLIDNGLKYSLDNQIKIIANKHEINFISRGKALEHELSFYLEPFIQGNHENNKKSFGLGLYIVQNILKNHKLSLKYEYQGGFNIFSITHLDTLRVD
ncbi:MAG: two-component sensor histidine kinase [Proteobacteria bacterium]|nr:MAG: two-component sensor histidine kinase [Pseudomonadota bacterium]